MNAWPATSADLVREQEMLARAEPEPWTPVGETTIGGSFVCWSRGKSGAGAAGDRGWAAAAVVRGGRVVAGAVSEGAAGAPYAAGLLALREGPLLAAAVGAIDPQPDLVILDATGRDHPRRAGLAVHLGAVLAVPTAGVTHRLLVAEGTWPSDEAEATSPIYLEGEVVGRWMRTRKGTRPLAVHAGWRVDVDTAVALVLDSLGSAARRTPEPLREARRLARDARAKA
jgi:deoxyribonuclease V